jgi:hypothetical protein
VRIILLEQNTKKVGLQINTTKTEVLIKTRANNPTVQNITIGVQKIDAVKLILAQQSLATVMKWKRSRVGYAERTNYTMHFYQY